jgi:hypothetical protein
MTFGLQLRNGDPYDPVSNNTSYDGAFQFKEFNLAQGYLDCQFAESFGVIGGKFDAKKRWKVSDMQWDDDVTVEGLMENFDLGGGDGSFKGVDIALYQFMLEESKNSSDSRMYGAQARANFKAGDNGTFFIGAGYDTFDNPQGIADLTLEGELGGNNMTNIVDEDGMLISDFDILNFHAEYKHTASKKWPVKVNLFYYQNLGAEGIARDENTAYFGRLQVGGLQETVAGGLPLQLLLLRAGRPVLRLHPVGYLARFRPGGPPLRCPDGLRGQIVFQPDVLQHEHGRRPG